jgi:hypothetical protein
VVYVDGRPFETLGGQTYEAKLGPFDAGDTRRFAVAAVDLAGNHGAHTSTFVGVPELVGLTRDQARDAVAARGLVLRAQSGRRAAAVEQGDLVLTQTPEAPLLVATGTAVGIVLSTSGEAQPLLLFTGLTVGCRPPARITVRLTLAQRARVVVTLLDRRGAVAFAWRVGFLAGGESRRSLRLPAAIKGGAGYRVVVAATAAGRTERLSKSLPARAAAGRRTPGCAPA